MQVDFSLYKVKIEKNYLFGLFKRKVDFIYPFCVIENEGEDTIEKEYLTKLMKLFRIVYPKYHSFMLVIKKGDSVKYRQCCRSGLSPLYMVKEENLPIKDLVLKEI